MINRNGRRYVPRDRAESTLAQLVRSLGLRERGAPVERRARGRRSPFQLGPQGGLRNAAMGRAPGEPKTIEEDTNGTGSRRVYSSPPVLHASGAASSNRVWRLRNTKFRLPVGPLRCLAMISSARARSSSGMSVL